MDYSTLLPQIKSLHAKMPKRRILPILIQTLFKANCARDNGKKSLADRYLTVLLWEFIAETLPTNLLQIVEPSSTLSGRVLWNKRYVTQELALAILDFHAITQVTGPSFQSVLALGANQWKLGYVFLQQIPNLKYIIVDTPSELRDVQKHFERIFPEKKIFSERAFDSYHAVAKEFEEASICLIHHEQLSLLPQKSIDLGLTINVLDQLSLNAINHYFGELALLIKGYFYFKEQKISAIKEADYRLPEEWEEVFWRTSPLCPASFEALFFQGAS